MSERINNFWRLDLLGITEEEEESEGLGNVTFQNGRYKVELPFKEGHPLLADNFTLSKKEAREIERAIR